MVRAEDETLGEAVIGDPVIAAIAAHAATSVAGVVRLEPGVSGLVTALTRSVRQQIKGLNPAPTEGVRVQRRQAESGATVMSLEIDLVTSTQDQAAAVGRAVQRAVTKIVFDATGLLPAEVRVSIMDIALPRTGV